MRPSRIADNPFLVLSVAPTATRMEVERAGQKLLAQLSIGVKSAASYSTPLGLRERDEATVRAALGTLRNPEERVLAELWFTEATSTQPDAQVRTFAPWAEALRSIGWRGPWAG